MINSEGTLIYTPNTCDSPMGSINGLRSNNLDAVDVCNFSNNWNNPWNIALHAYNDVITSRAFPHHWPFVRLIRRWPGLPSQSVSNVICRIFVLVAGQAAEQTVVWPVVWDASSLWRNCNKVVCVVLMAYDWDAHHQVTHVTKLFAKICKFHTGHIVIVFCKLNVSSTTYSFVIFVSLRLGPNSNGF